MAMAAGLTSAIMSHRRVCVEAVRAADLLLGHDPWGSRWIAAHRARQAQRRPPRRSRGDAMSRRPHKRAARTRRRLAAHDGADRVRLRFLPDGAEVRVPSGTPMFDAASWNGIAIDSTCGGHGTCKKCKVRIVSGDVPVGDLRSARVQRRGAARGLAAGLPGRRPRRPRGRGAAAADAPESGAGRRRPARDPAPVGAEAPPGARGADDGGPALRRPAGARRDRRPGADALDRAAARARRDPPRRRTSTSPRSSATRS